MIYLDHAAATPLCAQAKAAIEPYLSDQFFNPSAPYLPAIDVKSAYETAKNTIATAIGGKGLDLVITSGATESINLAFTAVQHDSPTILISAVEHPAVFAAGERVGKCDVVKVDQTGRVDLSDLKQKLTAKTGLVSICLVSSELGTIQPISEVAALLRAERQRRLQNGNQTPLFLHCDASQGLGLLDVKVARLGVDLLTLNAAKIYGPKGVGALWTSHAVKLHPLIVGGGQESGVRSGTENIPAVVGFAAAVTEAVKHASSESRRLKSLQQTLFSALSTNPSIKFPGHSKHQLASFLPITIPGLDAERLIFKLEQQSIYISTGAACSASKGIKSRALSAIGLSDEEIAGSLRLTLGRLSTETNTKQAARSILAVIAAEQERLAC